MFTITVANTYLVDSNHTKAASGTTFDKIVSSFTNAYRIVVSVNNFTRNICGMIFSLTAVQIRTSLGDGWA